jgi:hypothetical protein
MDAEAKAKFCGQQVVKGSTVNFVFEFESARREHVRASRVISLRRPIIRTLLAMSVLAALAATLAFLMGPTWIGRVPSFLLGLGWFLPVGVLAGLIIGPEVQVSALRRRNLAAAGPQVYKLTDSGLEACSTGVTTTLKWDNIVEVVETREFFLFYFAASWALFLPKRVVPQESLPLLRMSLAQRVGARARLRE